MEDDGFYLVFFHNNIKKLMTQICQGFMKKAEVNGSVEGELETKEVIFLLHFLF